MEKWLYALTFKEQTRIQTLHCQNKINVASKQQHNVLDCTNTRAIHVHIFTCVEHEYLQ